VRQHSLMKASAVTVADRRPGADVYTLERGSACLATAHVARGAGRG
jgi:hypothetical protein